MLKKTDLLENHGYVSQNVTMSYGVLHKRIISNINHKQEKVTYLDVKGCKGGMKVNTKTTSVQAFLSWAVADITCKEE